jgi:hypothetical protein
MSRNSLQLLLRELKLWGSKFATLKNSITFQSSPIQV